MTLTASQKLNFRARDLAHSSGRSFSSALATIRACNPDLVKAAAGETGRPTIANATQPASPSRKDRAGAWDKIREEVARRMRTNGESHEVAWHAVTTSTHRDLFTFANDGAPQGGYESQKQTKADQEAAGQHNADRVALGLPVNCQDDEFSTALRANGGTTGSPDFDLIFVALAKLYARKHSVSLDVAKGFAVGRYPILAAKVSADCKPSFERHTTTGKSFAA